MLLTKLAGVRKSPNFSNSNNSAYLTLLVSTTQTCRLTIGHKPTINGLKTTAKCELTWPCSFTSRKLDRVMKTPTVWRFSSTPQRLSSLPIWSLSLRSAMKSTPTPGVGAQVSRYLTNLMLILGTTRHCAEVKAESTWRGFPKFLKTESSCSKVTKGLPPKQLRRKSTTSSSEICLQLIRLPTCRTSTTKTTSKLQRLQPTQI